MGIDFELWELPKAPQRKIKGVGYSSVYLMNEDKATLSYKLWKQMIDLCYGIGDYYDKRRKGRKFECCNSWLDYQKFLKWFNSNTKEFQGNNMVLTKCVISKDNTTYNPNNCAVVPKEISVYLERENPNMDRAKELAETYKDCITDDIYELLTEDFYYE